MSATPSRLSCLVRLAQLRYVSFPGAVFAYGYLGTDTGVDAYLAMGILAFLVWEAVLHLYNHVADRAGDQIDYPERTAMCRLIGYDQLRNASFALAVAYTGLVMLMIVVFRISAVVGLIWMGLLWGAFGYSRGPRLKARTYGSVAILALLVVVALALGWWYRGGISEVVPVAAVICLARVSCSWSKDLPNLEGDSATGFYSVSHYLVAAATAGRRAEGVLLLPYAAIGSFVLLGVRPVHDLIALTLLPVGMVLAHAMRAAESLEERAFVPELANLYLIALIGLVGVSLNPGVAPVVVLVASLAWYVVGTRYLHTEPDLLTRRSLDVFAHLVRRREQVQRASA
jgi:hypothetical protein